MTYYHTVEVNTGARAYYPGCKGTGTGALDSFTVADDTWESGLLNGNFNLIDKDDNVFLITSNTEKVLEVVGTPVTGDYTILPTVTGFIGGTTVIVDADKIDIDWMNAILSIQRPVSKNTQKQVFNNGDAYTYDPTRRIVYLTLPTVFETSLKQGDILRIDGVDYPLQQTPTLNIARINPLPPPPASGNLTAYKTQKDYGINLKKIISQITIDGWITNDHVHHPEFSTKRYTEEKVEDLHEVCGANAGNPNFSNLALREGTILPLKYMRPTADGGTNGVGTLDTLTDTTKNWEDDEWISFTLVDKADKHFTITDNDATTLTVSGTPTTGVYRIVGATVSGCLACTKMKIIDQAKDCAPVRGGGGVAQRTDKMRVTLSFRYQDPR